jgi:MFS family permease
MKETKMATEPKNKDFSFVLTSGFISLVGDQITLLALPWLVLVMSGDPIQVGGVIAVLGIPRAILVLFGGSIVDRYSPRQALIYTRYASAVVLAIFTTLVAMDAVTWPAIYITALLLGILTAISIPASLSILPTILPPEGLSKGVGVTMSAQQFAALIGPVLAAAILGVFNVDLNGEIGLAEGGSRTGFAITFALDLVSFIVSAMLLHKITPRYPAPKQTERSPFKLIASGFNYITGNRTLTILLCYVSIISIVVLGPTIVGVPLLVEANFGGESTIFGGLRAAHGAGLLAGSVLAVVLGQRLFRSMGITILLCDILIGSAFILFATTTNVLGAHLDIFVIGLLGGLIQVAVFSWVQANTPPEYMGRVMSFLMFGLVGLVPVSSYISGLLVEIFSVQALFQWLGAIMAIMAFLALVFVAPLRRLTYVVPQSSAAAAQ